LLTSDAKNNANNVKKYKKMKIRTGKYHSQMGFGIHYICPNNVKYFVIDFGIYYVEFIIRDYE